MVRHSSVQAELASQKVDALALFKNACQLTPPWDSIIDFATHPAFCGQKLYPKQRTLLKLVYLETENMTDFDLTVIENWRERFLDHKEVSGVQPDIWQRVKWLRERGYRHFPHVQFVIGRRGSKGVCGGIIGAERMAYFWWLDNWQARFGVKDHSNGYLSVVATTIDQAKMYQFNDIRLVVRACTYLQPHISSDKAYYMSLRTPTDIAYGAELLSKRIPTEDEIASIRMQAFSANSASSRGGAMFATFLDEFAHQITGTGSNVTGEQIYTASQPSLRQFKKHKFTFIPSTPFSQIGQFFQLYNEGSILLSEDGTITRITETDLQVDSDEIMATKIISANPTMLIAQFPSWELYEKYEESHLLPVRTPQYHKPGMRKYGPKFDEAIVEYDEELQILERVNPESFDVEYRGQFATVQDAYLKKEKVQAMYDPIAWREPLVPQTHGDFQYKYRIHCDPGLSGANFALCVAHLEEAPPVIDRIKDHKGRMVDTERKWQHVIVDYIKVWRPMDYKDGVVDYVEVRDDIRNILQRFQSTSEISFDQWQSSLFLAELKREFTPDIRVTEKTFTSDENYNRFERFKSALNLGWVHAYRDNFYKDNENCLLELELTFLQRKPTGKIDKQEVGPVQTKDLADCLMVCTTELLHAQHDIWWNERMNTGAHGSTDTAGLKSGREFERFEALMGHTSSSKAAKKMRDSIIQQRDDRTRGFGKGRTPTRGGRFAK